MSTHTTVAVVTGRLDAGSTRRCDVYVDHKPYTQHDRVRCARKATFRVAGDGYECHFCTQHASGRSRTVRNILREERIASGKTKA